MTTLRTHPVGTIILIFLILLVLTNVAYAIGITNTQRSQERPVLRLPSGEILVVEQIQGGGGTNFPVIEIAMPIRPVTTVTKQAALATPDL